MSSPRTAIVVPCFNEAGRLRAETFRSFAGARADVTLVLVDDGSTDETATVLESIASELSNVTSVRLPQNRGKAEAVRAGVVEALESSPGYFGYWDADLSTPLEDVSDFEALLDAKPEVDVVLGSRVLLLGRDIVRRPTRHYFGRVFATVVSIQLGLPVYDTQCGAKLFRNTESTAALFATPFLSRWVFDVEILARLLAARGADARTAIVELPLTRWHHQPGSKVGFLDLPGVAFDLARLYLRY